MTIQPNQKRKTQDKKKKLKTIMNELKYVMKKLENHKIASYDKIKAKMMKNPGEVGMEVLLEILSNHRMIRKKQKF